MRFVKSLYFKFFLIVAVVLFLSNLLLFWVYNLYGKEKLGKIIDNEAGLIKEKTREWSKKINEAFYLSLVLSKSRTQKFEEKEIQNLKNNVKVMRKERGIDAVNLFVPDSINEPKMAISGDEIESDKITNSVNCLSCHSQDLTPYRLKALKMDENAFVYGEVAKNLKNESSYQIVTHLYNKKSCQACHDPNNKMTGVIQLNFNMTEGNKALEEAKLATTKEVEKTGNLIRLMFFVNIGIALIASFLVSFVVKKIVKLKDVFENVCYGNLNVDIDKITKSEDEIGEIGEALSRMVTAIKIYLK